MEGIVTKEISCIPRDASHGQITYIAWKGDQVILGDTNGDLHYWDLEKKQSSTKSSHRGWVKKVRLDNKDRSGNIAVPCCKLSLGNI